MGDPAGIGPEIFLKAISKINSKEIFEKIVVVSSLSVLDFINSQLKFGFKFNELFNIKDVKPNKINFINVQNCPNYKVGKSDENNAGYVIDCINIASDLAFENRFNLVTGPINKSVISGGKSYVALSICITDPTCRIYHMKFFKVFVIPN